MLPPADQLCAVGVITKVFGIKGEVKLHSYERSAEDIASMEVLLLGRQAASIRQMKLEAVRVRGADIYLKIENINDRSAAETLIGHFLFIDEKKRTHLPEGRYFIDDLIGLDVQDEQGRTLGSIRDVMTSTPQTLLVVRTGHGDVLVPNVPAIVSCVDREKKLVVLTPPEGLFGEDAS